MTDVEKILKEMPPNESLDIIRWAYLMGCKNPQIINNKGDPDFSYQKDKYKNVFDYNIIHALVKEGYLKEYTTPPPLYIYVMSIFGQPSYLIRKIETTKKGEKEIKRIEKKNLPIITPITPEEVEKIWKAISTDVPIDERYV